MMALVHEVNVRETGGWWIKVALDATLVELCCNVGSSAMVRQKELGRLW